MPGWERLTKKEVALEKKVGAGSGEETQERAGAGEGEVAGFVLKEEGVPGVHSTPGNGVYT